MRKKVAQHIKSTVLGLGTRLDEGHLARLRSALGYVEIGSMVKRLGNGTRVPVLRDRFEVFERARRAITGSKPLYLEFGVFEGETMRWWSEHLDHPNAHLVGFDSFAGLPEHWRPGFDAGMFATGRAPSLDDSRVSFVSGWFDDTLPLFDLPDHDQLVVNVDCDLYSSASTVLAWIEPHLAPGALLYFDELANRDDELRALNDLLGRSSVELTPLALAGSGTHMLFRVGEGA
jgi:hypothetical protein